MTLTLPQITKVLETEYPSGGWSVKDTGISITIDFGTNPFISSENMISKYNALPQSWLDVREKKYSEKGWNSLYDLFDDMAERGVDAVISEIQQMKGS